MESTSQSPEPEWGYWKVYEKIDDFEAEISKIVPNPRTYRLLEINREYSVEELRALLQNYGSYLSTLHGYKGLIKGQTHGIKAAFNDGMKVAISRIGGGATNTAKEGEVLKVDKTLRTAHQLQAEQEAIFEVINGWVDAYQSSWDTISRMITVHMGEVALQTNRSV